MPSTPAPSTASSLHSAARQRPSGAGHGQQSRLQRGSATARLRARGIRVWLGSVACRAAGPDHDDPETAEAWKYGVPEAEDILARAVQLAEEATLKELMQAQQADIGAGTAVDAASRDALARVWLDEGLRPPEATFLAERCSDLGGALADPDALFARLERWRRVLPGVRIAAVASRHNDLLTADVGAAIRNVLALTRVLSSLDAIALVEAHPPLLWAEAGSVEACAAESVRLLKSWSPRSDPEMILESYPELIFRLPKFYSDYEFFQLPIEIQNVMAENYMRSGCDAADSIDCSDAFESLDAFRPFEQDPTLGDLF